MYKYLVIGYCLLWSFTTLHSQTKEESLMTNTSAVSYDEITLNDIKSIQLQSGSRYSLIKKYGFPVLFYYRTNEGRYGKMEYLSEDRLTAIYIRWTTYNADGSVFSGAQANLKIPRYSGCDLDLGVIQGEGVDFIWSYEYSRHNLGSGNGFEPRNGAAFYRFDQSNSGLKKVSKNDVYDQVDNGLSKNKNSAMKANPNPVTTPETTTQTSSSSLYPQRRLALVIGNSAYANPKDVLPNPVNDATDITTALREMGFEVITSTNATQQKMDAAIADFGTRLKNYNLGFFYYAGHGVQIDGENYLVPVDAALKSQGEVRYECYPVGRILAKMEEAAIQANVIVLDACRDNPFSRSWSRSLVSGGLASINAPQGTFIGFATSPGAKSSDGEGRNGVYTAALLEHLRKPNQTIDQLFNAVSGSVKKKTNSQQVPWKTSSLSEDLYLRN